MLVPHLLLLPPPGPVAARFDREYWRYEIERESAMNQRPQRRFV